VVVTFVLWGCSDGGEVPGALPVPVALSPREQAIRVSVAVRGIRPTLDEIALVDTDPDALDVLVDEWLESPWFLETVRDLHAEQFAVRTDADDDLKLPAFGPLADRSVTEITESVQEEPLRFVEYVVANHLPYTDVVDADYTVADSIVSAVYGLPYDPTGPEWQPTTWMDGRPHAGVLSSSQLWRRHVSAGNSFHRGRANFVANIFLCENLATRNVSLVSDANLADPLAVADAVRTDPACVSCHQTLDPLAGVFWGFVPELNNNAVTQAFQANCSTPPLADLAGKFDALPYELTCYPSHLYLPADEGGWYDQDLRPPGYFGEPMEDLSDLGREIAADPRFATCAARRFWSYLTQVDRAVLPEQVAAELGEAFAAGGYEVRSLVRDIVLSDAFLSRPIDGDPLGVPALVLRPEALDRSVAEITGFEWLVNPADDFCQAPCRMSIPLMRSDLYGFRSMAGGVDGTHVTRPTHLPTAVKSLSGARLAELAASWVVENDRVIADADRKLLAGIVLDDPSEAAVRSGLALAHERVLGTPPDDIDVDEAWALYAGSVAQGAGSFDAWKLVIALLLQDPRMVVY
jgi:hypothetical protein